MQATDREIQSLYRALAHRDQDSWEGVWVDWRPRVTAWVRRHPQYRYTGEEVGYFVNRAFEKLWRALDGPKLEQFANPAQLIQYFKLCVHSVILDELRGMPSEAVFVAASADDLATVPSPASDVEEDALTRVRRRELWSTVSDHARTEEERVLVMAGLVRGLPPREIATRYPGLFGDVHEVYRVKRNLMERLSRDQRLRDFLS
jgi:DNA-directed RNA polymerase specialized sigma24 family protein